MKTLTTLICVLLAVGYSQAATAAGKVSAWGSFGYAGVYIGEIELDTINGFDCQQLIEFGIVDGCSARVLITISRDGSLKMVDTSDYSEGFDSPHAGTWSRSGRQTVATKTVGFGFDPDGDDIHTQVRTGEWEFAQDRRSFAGSTMTLVYNVDKDPLDPAAIADVTLVGTINARRID